MKTYPKSGNKPDQNGVYQEQESKRDGVFISGT
jgi:hypothetical protein